MTDANPRSALVTAEIRFWWPDRESGILSAWLAENGLILSAAGERTDIYIPTGNAAVNLKQRDRKKLEIKSLVGTRSLATRFAGQEQCELWLKQDLSGHPMAMDRQLPIKKTRWLAFADERGATAPGDSPLPSGCQIELSEVRSGGGLRVWTSFCLEAFGEADRLTHILDRLIERLDDLPSAHDPPLVASYAEWLCRNDDLNV